MFSTGVKLANKYPKSRLKPGIIIVLMSLVTPIGAIVGYILDEMEFNKLAKGAINGILECISISVFLYVSAFEILAEEKENKHSNFIQWLSYTAGFALIALILISEAFEDEPKHELYKNYRTSTETSILGSTLGVYDRRI
uniref:Uncharacterized protein n=1 Tax=Acrobeloides nanus TaxID=290746 RepID=A0A914CRW7_9BILA